MSYCRYDTSSGWYCYWRISDSNRRAEQIFTIAGVSDFTYKQLKDDLPACLASLGTTLNKAPTPKWKVAIEEMKGYMEQFIAEVEQDSELL